VPTANPTRPLKKAPSNGDKENFLFAWSAIVFRLGLALLTFEQDRVFELQFSDYFCFLSLILLAFSLRSRLTKAILTNISLGGALILFGGGLSFVTGSDIYDAAGQYARLVVLFGLFAPLAIVHSKNIRANLLFLLGGISINCAVAFIQAWIFPGIIDLLAVNPVRATDYGVFVNRFPGLSSHPNVLGLSAAFAILIGFSLLLSDQDRRDRVILTVQVVFCALGGVVSGSRTMIASLIPALFVLIAFQKQNRRAMFRVAIMISIIGGALSYLAPSFVSLYTERIGSSGKDYSQDYGRVMAAGLALAQISQRPFLGYGVDHLGEAGMMPIPETDEIGVAHNTFLQYWYGTGLIGGIGYLLFFFVPVRGMFKVRKQKLSPVTLQYLALGIACFLLMFIVSNLNPIVYNRFLYVPLAVFAGYSSRIWKSAKVGKPVARVVSALARPKLPATS
jgi:O-antigen ligase